MKHTVAGDKRLIIVGATGFIALFGCFQQICHPYEVQQPAWYGRPPA
jgi:hypothetical protein